jgi:hypothetical protein
MATPESSQSLPEQPMLQGFELPQVEEIARDISPIANHAPQAQTPTERYFEELGGGPGREDLMIDPPRMPRPPRKPRPTGHVRDVEPRDSDIDPYWNAPVEPLTPEGIAKRDKAVAGVRKLLEERALPGLVEERGNAQAQAILRARRERRERTS